MVTGNHSRNSRYKSSVMYKTEFNGFKMNELKPNYKNTSYNSWKINWRNCLYCLVSGNEQWHRMGSVNFFQWHWQKYSGVWIALLISSFFEGLREWGERN